MVRRQRVSKWGFVGIGGLACVLFLDLGTASIPPWWVTVLLVLLWLLLLVMAGASWGTHPKRLVWFAGFGFVVWLLVTLVGGILLGWGR